MNKYTRDVLGSIVFIILFGAFFGMAAGFPEEVRTYPWVICSIGFIFSAILLARSVLALQRYRTEPDTDPHMSRGQIMNIALTLIVAFAYVALSSVVGYFAMTFLFVTGFSYYLDSRHKKFVYPLVGIVMDLILYFAFAKFLNVNLPSGFLF